MRFYIGTILSMLTLLVGCQDIERIKKPDDLIGTETMEEILFDLAIVSAARGMNPQKMVQKKIKPETYVFEKYNIDSLQFATSTNYYATDLEKYGAMYRKVQERIDTLHTFHDNVYKADKKMKDSIKKIEAEERKKRQDSLKTKNGDSLNKDKGLRVTPAFLQRQLDTTAVF